MSSSPALARDADDQRVRPLAYPEAARPGDSPGHPGRPNAAPEAAELDRREAAARDAGRVEGEAQARATYEEQLRLLRDSIRLALLEFGHERASYFEKVEKEVVQLALSIARKVLHREAEVDPLLLAAMVHLALDQIESGTKVVVRVHPQHGADCRAFFARSMDAKEIPEVEEDPKLAPECCVLQTELGTTEIGVAVQLKEIEQGLMDLLEQRPKAGA